MKVSELKGLVPNELLESMKERGIAELTPPQALAIEAGLAKGASLVISSPTASGKTIIAEMAILRSVIGKGKKAIYVAPMRALVSEKYEEFKAAYPYLKIAMSIGDLDSLDPWLSKYDIVLASTEKLDSLIRHGLDWLESVGCIVFDEVHMIGESGRGPTLEILITKLKRICKETQFVSLSATIGNAEDIAKWMDAKLVESEYRPIKLDKGIVLGEKVFYRDEEVGLLGKSKISEIRIVEDVLAKNKQLIIFYSTKRNAEAGAEKMQKVVKDYLKELEKEKLSEVSKRVVGALSKPTSQCEKLGKTILGGAAFHHGGLMNEQRKEVENAFKNNLIKVICSTTTLCLMPNEEILTNFEPKQIQDLKSQDKVLTHAGKFKSVITPTKRRYKGTMVKITPYGQLPMTMTPEHRILISKRRRHNIHNHNGTHEVWWTYDTPIWRETKEIEKGDLVLFPRIKERKNIQKIKLRKLGPLVNQIGIVGKHWSRLRSDSLELDSQTLEAIGLFIAEGYTGKNGVIRFAINTKEQNLTDKITLWLTSLGLKANVQDFERHRRTINACSKQLSLKFRELFGSNAKNKHLPQDFLLLSNDKLSKIVEGMWLGDGSLYLKKTYGSAEYSTVSKTLAKQLFAILVKMGYMPRIKYVKAKETKPNPKYSVQIARHGNIYKVMISGKQLIKFAEEILKKELKFEGNRTFNLGKIDKDYYYMPVRKIEPVNYDGMVCNLEIEDDASYVGSFIVHNSLGINLPAHTVLVRDTSRYGDSGPEKISANEITQLFGRAGRPKYDTEGRALLIAKGQGEIRDLYNKYIDAELEPINSSLGMLPVLRAHVLAFIATDFLKSEEAIANFFAETFYGYQYSSMREINRNISEVLDELSSWDFIEKKGYAYNATKLGARVSELYIDPLSAKKIMNMLLKDRDELSSLFMITNTNEMKPHVKVTEEAEEKFIYYNSILASNKKGDSIEEFFYYPEKPFTTAMMIKDWIEEEGEAELVKKYSTTPGALFNKMTNADWMLYSAAEIAKIMHIGTIDLIELRVRVRYGIKKELLDLVQLEQVGRVRARMMHMHGITRAADLRAPGMDKTLEKLFGAEIARKILKQVRFE